LNVLKLIIFAKSENKGGEWGVCYQTPRIS
jgi:hypothetical protein